MPKLYFEVEVDANTSTPYLDSEETLHDIQQAFVAIVMAVENASVYKIATSSRIVAPNAEDERLKNV